MIRESKGFEYPGMPIKEYKNLPGAYEGVTRREFFPEADTQFATRYFEIAPGGYTSFEHHGHEHCVVVIRGSGDVRLGDDVSPIAVGDVVRVGPFMPHQFQNPTDEPLGIFCVVDKERDRPILLDSEGRPQPSNS